MFLTNCGTLTAAGSYGFSFGEADHSYLQRIIEHCDAETVWTLHCYTPAGHTGPLEDTGDAQTGREVLEELSYPGTLAYRTT